MTTAIVASDLAALADKINEEHRRCEGALLEGMEHAIRAGEHLLQAKELAPHGSWLGWLRDNFEGSKRTAQDYMRVAREVPRLPAEMRDAVAHLPYREIIRTLAAPREGDGRTPDGLHESEESANYRWARGVIKDSTNATPEDLIRAMNLHLHRQPLTKTDTADALEESLEAERAGELGPEYDPDDVLPPDNTASVGRMLDRPDLFDTWPQIDRPRNPTASVRAALYNDPAVRRLAKRFWVPVPYIVDHVMWAQGLPVDLDQYYDDEGCGP